MFENITKNVKIGDGCTSVLVNMDADLKKGNIETVCICYQGFDLDGTKEETHANANFIAHCFNLQQKYDIGLFEETVSQLQQILDYWDSGNFTRDPLMLGNTRRILSELKQNK